MKPVVVRRLQEYGLIFVLLTMQKLIGLQTFYKAINQAEVPVQHEIGHFNIFKVEDLLLPQYKQPSYNRRSFFKISLVKGHSKIHYADQVIEVKGNALVFTNPMIPYSWERISPEQKGYVCIFTEAFFNRFSNIKAYPVFQHVSAAIIDLSKKEVKQYEALFEKMFRELQGNYVYKYDLLRVFLMEIVHEAQKLQPVPGDTSMGSNASERITALFAELLERQFPIEFNDQVIQLSTPSEFAGQLNIHVNHLNKALKEITGQTTSRLIGERLMQEAKTLLKSTNWSIAEIAWGLGFDEPNHFSAFFKSKVKITPNQFRKS